MAATIRDARIDEVHIRKDDTLWITFEGDGYVQRCYIRMEHEGGPEIYINNVDTLPFEMAPIYADAMRREE